VAIATFAAVIVSLHIANKQHKEKIKIIGNTSGGVYDPKHGSLKGLKIINMGINAVYVEELYFASPKILKHLAHDVGFSRGNIKKLIPFIKGVISKKPGFLFIPTQYAKVDTLDENPIFPFVLDSLQSKEIMIPSHYFQETFFNNAFSKEKEIELKIIIETGTGKYHYGKIKTFNKNY
jgi:hypothetical protein